jgi:hypothetical protein
MSRGSALSSEALESRMTLAGGVGSGRHHASVGTRSAIADCSMRARVESARTAARDSSCWVRAISVCTDEERHARRAQ